MTDTAEGQPVEKPLPEDAVVDNEPQQPVGRPASETDHVVVEYKGDPQYGREFISSRTITKKDLAGIHLDAPGDLTWSPANGWKQDVGLEFEDLIAYFRKEKEFTVHTVS